MNRLDLTISDQPKSWTVIYTPLDLVVPPNAFTVGPKNSSLILNVNASFMCCLFCVMKTPFELIRNKATLLGRSGGLIKT